MEGQAVLHRKWTHGITGTRHVSRRSYKLQPPEAALFVLTVNISMMPFMTNWAGGPVECNCGGGGGGRYNNACTDRWDAPVSPIWALLHVADVKLEDLLPK